MAGKTISEKILSLKSGREVHAGDIAVCEVDCMIGTDASAPMAIDYFERMGGKGVAHPEKLFFFLDHYVPPGNSETARLQDRVRNFARSNGAAIMDVGEGISHQLAAELGLVLPGYLVVGADSHTVTGGALNAFATGVGSSDLAAAMLCGRLWFRVPQSVRVTLRGSLPAGLCAKDIALALVRELGADGAAYQALEYEGAATAGLDVDDRLVMCNMAVEMGAKAGIFAADAGTLEYLRGRTGSDIRPVEPDDDAAYGRELALNLPDLTPQVALPDRPDNVVSADEAAGIPIHMVLLGTCTGGRVGDFHRALRILESGGGIAPGVQVVVAPSSREVFLTLIRDGSIARLAEMGALVTAPGCGPCCGTAGPVPGDGMNVISTANRNFKARMGNERASIYLASPAVCAAAAVKGRIVNPRELEG